MKQNDKPAGSSFTKAMLKPILDSAKQNTNTLLQPSIENKPLKTAELDQDNGGGYNSNLVFPQQ